MKNNQPKIKFTFKGVDAVEGKHYVKQGRSFETIDANHQYLNETIEIESTNHGAPHNAKTYDGLPWSGKAKFSIVAPDFITLNGHVGNSFNHGKFL